MDEHEKSQFESMKQELALFQLNELKRNNELGKQINSVAKDYIFSNADLVNRIKVLEEARQIQRSLNVKFENGLALQEAQKEAPTGTPFRKETNKVQAAEAPKKWSFWR